MVQSPFRTSGRYTDIAHLSLSLSLCVLTAVFQVDLGQPVFIEAKDDGGGGNNWTTGAISRAKLQSNHHHQQTNIQFFYRPDALHKTFTRPYNENQGHLRPDSIFKYSPGLGLPTKDKRKLYSTTVTTWFSAMLTTHAAQWTNEAHERSQMSRQKKYDAAATQ